MSDIVNLNVQLAHAFGLPKHCRKAVLTLEYGQAPRWELEVFALPTVDNRTLRDPAEAAPEILRIPFVLRLATP